MWFINLIFLIVGALLGFLSGVGIEKYEKGKKAD